MGQVRVKGGPWGRSGLRPGRHPAQHVAQAEPPRVSLREASLAGRVGVSAGPCPRPLERLPLRPGPAGLLLPGCISRHSCAVSSFPSARYEEVGTGVTDVARGLALPHGVSECDEARPRQHLRRTRAGDLPSRCTRADPGAPGEPRTVPPAAARPAPAAT